MLITTDSVPHPLTLSRNLNTGSGLRCKQKLHQRMLHVCSVGCEARLGMGVYVLYVRGRQAGNEDLNVENRKTHLFSHIPRAVD